MDKKIILWSSVIVMLALVAGVLIFLGTKKESYVDKLDYKTDNTGGIFTLLGNAYLPYPSGELNIDPLYTSRKRIEYDYPNLMTEVPPGLFQKGNFNAVYTPDLQWCKNGNCSDNRIHFINAGEMFKNTSGKMFVSLDPQRVSQLVLDTSAYMFMNPDGSVCLRPVEIKDGRRVVQNQQCLSLTVKDNLSFSVEFIGLTVAGELQVLGTLGEAYPLHIHLGSEPTLNVKGPIMPSPKVSMQQGLIPYAVLLDDCSFAVYDGSGKFAYQASL